MIVFPVIGRELRASARQPFTYLLRVLGVGILLLACVVFGLDRGFGPELGSALFSSLHVSLFIAIWILVPLLTADCISRERREGTLGLLFLTRLHATDIVTAKSLAHGLRAITLSLAVVPVLTIPFLLGGVSWVQALFSLMINFSAICWAIAAGLLASAWSRRWLRALMAAMFLSFLFLLGLIFLVQIAMTLGPGMPFAGLRRTNFDFELLVGLGLITGQTRYPPLLTWTPWTTGQLLWIISQITAGSLLVLLFAIVLAGARTRRLWQERPASPLQLWWEKTFCTPRFWLGFFHRWMLRKLEKNPIGWLEQRTWTGRLVTWGWFAVIVSLYSAALSDRNFFRGLSGVQNTMAWLLAGSLAMSAAGSFRRERESGVLELLLVSPLREADIISGRLRGLWGQFLPSFVILLGLWAYFDKLILSPDASNSRAIWFHAISFVALPVIGLYFSLRCRNFIAAFISTVFVAFLVPFVLPLSFRFVEWRYQNASAGPWDTAPSFENSVMQLLIAGLCLRALYQRLKHRSFAFNQENRG